MHHAAQLLPHPGARPRPPRAPPRRRTGGRHPQCPVVPGCVMRLGTCWSPPLFLLCVLALRCGVMCGNYELLLVMVRMSAVCAQLTMARCWRGLTMRLCCARSCWRRACCMLTRTRVSRCPSLQWPHLITQPPHVRLSARVNRLKRSPEAVGMQPPACAPARCALAGRPPWARAAQRAGQRWRGSCRPWRKNTRMN